MREAGAMGERLRPMAPDDLDAVQALEASATSFPWTRGHFVDALAAGYAAAVLEGADGGIHAYVVLMAGVDELHLLNLATSPTQRRRGLASRLLGEAVRQCRQLGKRSIWLEVRAGNAAARALYGRHGFVEDGRRPRYYPTASGREDAVLMSLAVAGEPVACPEVSDAVD